MSMRPVKRTNARNRNALDPAVPERVTPAVISTVEQGGTPNVLEVTFRSRVMLRGTPGFRAGAGAALPVLSAQALSATVVELTFGGATGGQPLRVDANDPAIRTASGGFVPAGTYSIAA